MACQDEDAHEDIEDFGGDGDYNDVVNDSY
jgi:hypothetical protein